MTKYNDARNLFKNGDIVFFFGGKLRWIHHLITWFTGGPHYHVGIAFWMTPHANAAPRLMLAEAQPGGYRIVNLSSYEARGMTVIRGIVPWSSIANRVVDSPGNIPYDNIDLALIGLHEKFGIRIPESYTGVGEACSVIVAKILKAAGVDGLEVFVSPQRLLKQLVAICDPVFVVN